MKNFFDELKRRNVYKVAVAYAVGSWLVVQASSLLLATFEAPPWAMKAFVVFVALGFPIALILSWAFEITPEGIVRESEVEPGKSITHYTGRKIVRDYRGLCDCGRGLVCAPIGEAKRLRRQIGRSESDSRKIGDQAKFRRGSWHSTT
jgi:hypothetical protein